MLEINRINLKQLNRNSIGCNNFCQTSQVLNITVEIYLVMDCPIKRKKITWRQFKRKQ